MAMGKCNMHAYLYVQIECDRAIYFILRMYVRPPIKEEGDCGMVTIEGSQMKGGISILRKDTQREVH